MVLTRTEIFVGACVCVCVCVCVLPRLIDTRKACLHSFIKTIFVIQNVIRVLANRMLRAGSVNWPHVSWLNCL